MNKALTISLTLLTIIITACGKQTPYASRLLEPATATETLTQPTQSPAPTRSATPLPSPTIHIPETETPTETPAGSVGYANDVLPILENSCTKCHGVEQIKAG